jgi:hypothetical protein
MDAENSRPGCLITWYEEEQGVAINKNDLATLIDNMRSLAKQWRSSIGERGELVFYIDSC